MGPNLEDQLLRFGGGAAATNLTPASFILAMAAILLFFLLPRKYVIIPFVVATIFSPLEQAVVVGGLHFMVSRLILPFAWIRVILDQFSRDRNAHQLSFGPIDKVVIFWALSNALCFTLLWESGAAFLNRLGFFYNVLGGFFLLSRFLMRSQADVNRTIRTFAIVCGVLAIFMVREQLTGRNIFSLFGGVSEFTFVREGRLRSQAAFSVPILAGTFGATLLPLFVGLWWQDGKSKRIATVGIVSALVMTVTSSSATPVMACLAGITALFMWPLRRHMRLLVWGLVFMLLALHVVMKAPVWALIGRVQIVGGDSGWHRFELINQAVLHFGEWWLIGTRNPSSWGYELGDTSNAYVEAGVTGGLLTLVCFLGIVWQSFRSLRVARSAALRNCNRKLAFLLWACSAALFSHTVAFFGITYFDQTAMAWYSLLAIICTLTSFAQMPKVAQTSIGETYNRALGQLEPAPLSQPSGAYLAIGRQACSQAFSGWGARWMRSAREHSQSDMEYRSRLR